MSSENPSNQCPVITLDGLSGSGKSTLARKLAGELGWAYLDSGAWYRALTWAVLRASVDPTDSQAVLQVLSRLAISSQSDGQVLIDDLVLGKQLRTPMIDAAVSDVADPAEIRLALNQRMRGLRLNPKVTGIVADGRDAGAVIFPDASLKVYVDVSLEVRAQRRFEQMQAAGIEQTADAIHSALSDRDLRDCRRGEAAPQIHAGDRVLQNSDIPVEVAIRRLLEWAQALIQS
jgi:cytidylate kinase